MRKALAKWIISRKEGVLLAEEATTGELPDGMKRLNHGNQYNRLQVIDDRKAGCRIQLAQLTTGFELSSEICDLQSAFSTPGGRGPT
jgi:hypothetical protein